MGLLERFDPPAYLPDFNEIPDQLEQWHEAVSGWFDEYKAVASTKVPDGRVQFYNPATFDPGEPAVKQDIVWSAFPKELVRRYGYERALQEADKPRPLTEFAPQNTGAIMQRTPYRPLNEYCEWHVVRDPDTNKIKKVAFTSEPPEYWQALFGETIESDDGSSYEFTGNPELVLKLYRELVSREVRREDLIANETLMSEDPNGESFIKARKGHYNPYNKWNTTHGVVHLSSPPNTLKQQIELGADATVLRRDGRGYTLVDPEALVCCARYGVPDRNSDPTIGSTVNALARLGAYITLENPVGLYMDHIDLAGWEVPRGGSVSDCVRIVRGVPGMIVRLEVEVPPERGFTVSDLTIGGANIEYGGQIAECITMKFTGVAARPGAVDDPEPAPCEGQCWIDPNHATMLGRPVKCKDPKPIGKRPAFVIQGAETESSSSPAQKAEESLEEVHRRTRRRDPRGHGEENDGRY
jgi:hypothetical protein